MANGDNNNNQNANENANVNGENRPLSNEEREERRNTVRKAYEDAYKKLKAAKESASEEEINKAAVDYKKAAGEDLAFNLEYGADSVSINIYNSAQSELGEENVNDLFDIIKNSGNNYVKEQVENLVSYNKYSVAALNNYKIATAKDDEIIIENEKDLTTEQISQAKAEKKEQNKKEFFENMPKAMAARKKLDYKVAFQHSKITAADMGEITAYAYNTFERDYLEQVDYVDREAFNSILETINNKIEYYNESKDESNEKRAEKCAEYYKDLVTVWNKKEIGSNHIHQYTELSNNMLTIYDQCTKNYGIAFTDKIDEFMLAEAKKIDYENNVIDNGDLYKPLQEDQWYALYEKRLKDLRYDLQDPATTITEEDTIERMANIAKLASHFESERRYPQYVTKTQYDFTLAFAEAYNKFGSDFVKKFSEKNSDLFKNSILPNSLDVLEGELNRLDNNENYRPVIAAENIPVVYWALVKGLNENMMDPNTVERFASVYMSASEQIGEDFTDLVNEPLEFYPEVIRKSQELRNNLISSGGYLPIDKENFKQQLDLYKKSVLPENLPLKSFYDKLPSKEQTEKMLKDGQNLSKYDQDTKDNLRNKFELAREELRKGPEASDPVNMLKWCRKTSMLTDKIYREYADKAGLSDDFLNDKDKARIQLIKQWSTVYGDFPEEIHDDLLKKGGASGIAEPENIASVSNPDYNLKTAIDDLKKAYNNADIHPAADPEMKNWIKGDTENSFSYQVPDENLNKLNIKTLRKNLKSLQKEINATDHFWMKNSEDFGTLKSLLSETVSSLKKYKKGDKQAYKDLMEKTEKLADISKKYYTKKEKDYLHSNKDREKRRAKAASKIFAFASAFTVNENIKSAAMEAQHKKKELNQNERVEEFCEAVRLSLKYPKKQAWQNELALICDMQYKQHGEKLIHEAIDNMKIPGVNDPEAIQTEKDKIIHTIGELKNLAKDVKNEFKKENAPAALENQAEVNNGAIPFKSVFTD